MFVVGRAGTIKGGTGGGSFHEHSWSNTTTTSSACRDGGQPRKGIVAGQGGNFKTTGTTRCLPGCPARGDANHSATGNRLRERLERLWRDSTVETRGMGCYSHGVGKARHSRGTGIRRRKASANKTGDRKSVSRVRIRVNGYRIERRSNRSRQQGTGGLDRGIDGIQHGAWRPSRR
ncbi:hypothetical protein VTN49DRAFT_3119 [Thermomyces lanuginosus]|uniref:uncharacterized protein n=1 Tax=Thermomyces lanuginosus TaxID=5541 RepID=UPI003743C2FA